MPLVLGGNNPDLSAKQVMALIITKLKDSWTETNPPVNDLNEFKNINFNHDWNDNAHDINVSVILNTDVMGFASLGATSWDHGMFIEIHIFVRELSEDYPDVMGNIEKEISRILYSNIRGFKGHGISLVLPNSFRRIDEEDNTSTVWHSMMSLQIVFMKFIVP